ncbi:hypothetical protein [Cloacibacillus porcorum]|uniref:hypothetical protein n=1 Tax=Cloacibacillus porcorum TaxID=1197717 RepID=UPI003EFF8CAD
MLYSAAVVHAGMFLVWRFTLPLPRLFDASAELLSIGDCAMCVVVLLPLLQRLYAERLGAVECL